MASSHRDDQLSSQIPHVMAQDRFRRRVTREDLSVSGSARRHLWAQLNTDNLAAVHRPEFSSRSRLRLVEEMRMKPAPNEKECRARALSHLRHNSRSSSGSSGSKVAHLQQPNTARDTGSRKAETRSNQKKRHHHGRNNFGAITPAAPEVKLRSRFFC